MERITMAKQLYKVTRTHVTTETIHVEANNRGMAKIRAKSAFDLGDCAHEETTLVEATPVLVSPEPTTNG